MKTWSVAFAVLAAAAVHAEDARSFGDAGEIIPSGSLSFLHADSENVLFISPKIQFFAARDLAVGIGLVYEHLWGTGFPTEDVYGGSISVGYNLRLAPLVSLFPQFEITAQRRILSDVPPGSPLTGGGATEVGVELFVPFLVHPVQHFFLGIGPAFSVFGSESFRTESVSLQTIIGGWL
jgi:hypothetical protein